MDPLTMVDVPPAVIEVAVPVSVPGRRWPWVVALMAVVLAGAGAFVALRRSSSLEQERRRKQAEELGSHAAPQPLDDGNLVAADG